MGKITILILLVAILVESGYCFNRRSVSSYTYSSSSSQLWPGRTNPAVDFYEAAIKGQSGNVIMSSILAKASLSLLYCGASGQTASIMANSLLYNGQAQNQVAQEYQKFLAPLHTQSQIVNIANGLFLTQNYDIQPKFLSTAKTDLYSNVQTLNFADSSGAAATINDWVTEETRGKITNLIPVQDLGVDTSMVLVNAISFHGNWQTPFDASQTKPANFYTGNWPSGGVTTVQMMNVYSTFKFVIDNYLNAQIIQLPYAGTDISMLVFLPRLYIELSALENKLSTFNFANMYGDLYPHYVNLSLPKFDIESTFNLKTPLEALGLGQIFTPAANFSNIIESASGQPQQINVSAMIQKAYISVNEQGATGPEAQKNWGTMIPTPPAVIFNANHPFVYALATPTEILLMGRFVQ